MTVDQLYNELESKVHTLRPGEDLAPLREAFAFAEEHHRDQVRDSGEPYITHPLEVAHILADMQMDLVCLETGLLHDVVEDTAVKLEQVQKRFGPEVAICVDGVTKLNKLQLHSREARQAENMRKMLLAMVTDIRVILVKLATGCEKLRARDNLNKGVQAFKSAKYAQAVEHFERAVQLDPEFITARLYLATAHMSQYIPGADSKENQQNAQAAEQEFQKVLEKDPKNSIAIASIASLHYQQAQGNQPLDQKIRKLDDAAEWYKKLADVEPTNKEAFYSLGVITFNKYYAAVLTARNKLGMKSEDPGPLKDKKVKEEMKTQWLEPVNAGIANLEKALQIDPEYDDAMAYLNLLIRYRADLDDTREQYTKDIEVADNWVQKSLETKKIKAERVAHKAASGGIKAE